MLEAFTRLAELLDTPEHIEYLAPLLIREIHYRLLTGPLGKHVMAINMFGTQANRIAFAITWLENNYKAAIKIEDLAHHVNMSVSTFHRNFKRMTTLSPLQFQKKLRLLEAQRLMLTDGMDATSAAYEVGYESSAQFNREYKRMFGNPPLKDIRTILAYAR
jgi:AraC-like DNA-binding protein